MAVYILLGLAALVGLTYLILTVGWRGRALPPGRSREFLNQSKAYKVQVHQLFRS